MSRDDAVNIFLGSVGIGFFATGMAFMAPLGVMRAFGATVCVIIGSWFLVAFAREFV